MNKKTVLYIIEETGHDKGQLISKYPFGVFKSTKKTTQIL